jgi:hypothetical protein
MQKKQGLVKNKLIIYWTSDIAAVYKKKRESFKATNINGAQKAVERRKIASIEKAEYYDCLGQKTLLPLIPQRVFNLSN